ncbi:MAG: SH3 domain-containing protein [Pseudomonadota bacterium]
MLRHRSHRCRAWTWLATGCLIGLLTAVLAVAAPTTGTVTQNVNLREGPGTRYRVLTGITAGTRVDISKQENQWVQISVTKNHLDYSGWVFASYLNAAAVGAPALPAPMSETPQPPSIAPEPAAAAADDAAEARPDAAAAPPQLTPIPLPETTAAAPPQAPAEPATAPPAPRTEDLNFGQIMAIAAGILSLLAMIVSWQALRFARKYRRLVQDFESVRRKTENRVLTMQEKRRNPRIERLVEVDFAVGGRFYRGLIDSLSAGGVFIKTSAELAVDDAITVSYPAPNNAGHIKREGQITRITKIGIAVNFTAPAEGECDAP